MSRGAALAYAVEEWIEQEPALPAPDTSLYRLLGEQTGAAAPSTPLYTLSAPASPRYEPQPAHTAAVAQTGPFATYSDYAYSDYGYYGEETAQPRAARPRMGRLVAGVALLATVLAALAVGATSYARNGSTGLHLSSYRDAALASAASANASGPVIDASSGNSAAEPPQEAAPPPASASAPASLMPAASNYALQGPPTISVGRIEAVLAQYGSPAAGQGQRLYDLGVKYGINPAFALAFFVHESGCGTKGVARFSKSLGNIRWTEGYGNYEGYRSYPSWEAGMEDWYQLIKGLYIEGWGLRTVAAIIPVYAPSADHNNPTAYIASVEYLVDSWREK